MFRTSTFRLPPRIRLAVVTAPLLVTIGACGVAPAPGAQALALTPAHVESRQSYVLSGSALRRDDARSLLDIVAERWPNMVRGELPRGAGLRITPLPAVFTQDRFGVYDTHGAYLGGPEHLATMRSADVQQLRRLTEMEETAKFGHSHPAGAVIVTWAGDARPR